jgi:hypothetical protein
MPDYSVLAQESPHRVPGDAATLDAPNLSHKRRRQRWSSILLDRGQRECIIPQCVDRVDLQTVRTPGESKAVELADNESHASGCGHLPQ